ncbi:MAG TPA: hypothetical protein VMW52_02955, partial [Phycisphaerae bacterium]|nr:hypothetical protein [Phycisphaerae bacterium]
TAWANLPTVGDLVYIPTGSPFAAANEGSYVVTAVTTTRLDLYKVLDAVGAGSTLTAPATEGPVAVAATTDVAAYAPVVISSSAGAVVPGKGKTLEIVNTATGSFAAVAFGADATSTNPVAPATWVSVSGTPAVLTAGAEYRVNLNVAREADTVSNDVAAGGDVLLSIGYTGTTASAVIAAGVLTITVAGGAGTSQTIALGDYATVNDLVTYINTLAGYTAAAGSAALGQRSSLTLDAGTYGAATKWGAKTARIKADGKAFLDAVNAGAGLLSVAPVAPATALVGLPDVASLAFLAGGSRGATSNADIGAALTALEAVKGNFVVPLFSRDATTDIAVGLTDSGSTYTIDSVHAQARTHVLQLSQLKRRRRRQAVLSYSGTFAEAKAKAGNMATYRAAMAFQDVLAVNAARNIQQFQPWMMAAKIAGAQAAAGYRALVAKFINTSGVLQAAGDFNDQSISDMEDALLSGLFPAQRDDDGGFKWTSDQTTYVRDDNFFFNSFQAVYIGDLVAATAEVRMEKAFVGQSTADISPTLALQVFESVLDDMRRLKWLAASADAPKGYKNPKVRISGTAMPCSAEIKIAGAIYFIPIAFLVTPVTGAAG